MTPYSPLRSLGLAAVSITNVSLILMSLLLAACSTPPPAERPAKPVASPPPAELPAVPTQEELALRSIALLQERLYRVAAPLLMNNAKLCKAHAQYLLGFAAKNGYSYPSAYRSAAQKVLRLGDKLQVMDVLPGSGAAKTGVRAGDILLSVEDNPLPEGEHAEQRTAAMLAPLVARHSEIKLTVQRHGHDASMHVPLTHACVFGLELGNTDAAVAFSDGYRILVSRGMMELAGTDDELAYVLAKEIAHNLLSRRNRRQTDAAIAPLIDNLTRIQPDLNTMNSANEMRPTPQKLDAKSDRLAFYMLARAGYKLDGVVPFLRRLATGQPSVAPYSYGMMHPATGSRMAGMEITVMEIRKKQTHRKPLLP